MSPELTALLTRIGALVADGVCTPAEAIEIDRKLQGVLNKHGMAPLSVQGQVQQLINEATDVKNLGEMYLWWMPWV